MVLVLRKGARTLDFAMGRGVGQEALEISCVRSRRVKDGRRTRSGLSVCTYRSQKIRLLARVVALYIYTIIYLFIYVFIYLRICTHVYT